MAPVDRANYGQGLFKAFTFLEMWRRCMQPPLAPIKTFRLIHHIIDRQFLASTLSLNIPVVVIVVMRLQVITLRHGLTSLLDQRQRPMERWQELGGFLLRQSRQRRPSTGGGVSAWQGPWPPETDEVYLSDDDLAEDYLDLDATGITLTSNEMQQSFIQQLLWVSPTHAAEPQWLL